MPAEFLRYAKKKYKKGEPKPLHLLAPQLTTLLNCAFHQGVVPTTLNSSWITPVFKKGDPFDTANYRPIAVMQPIACLCAGVLKARRDWILPPWEGGPVRLPSCQTLIACHGEAASPIVGRAVDAPIPEVSFSCLLILLHLASLAGM